MIRIPALPFCHAEVWSAKPKSERYPKKLNTLGGHIRARRIDLGLLQKHVAEQIGVCTETLTHWERNATRPVARYMPAIIRFLGYDPLPPAGSFPERLAGARRRLGMTQRKMAERLGIDPSTLGSWEAGQHQPTGKSLQIIETVLGKCGRICSDP